MAMIQCVSLAITLILQESFLDATMYIGFGVNSSSWGYVVLT